MKQPQVIDTDEVMRILTEYLEAADPVWVAKIFNDCCPALIEYVGDGDYHIAWDDEDTEIAPTL